jgi:ABC-type multidrug transport system fused ATPase/permease subunit
MPGTMAQVVLGGMYLEGYENTTSLYHAPIFKSQICWNHPWDVRQAKFEPCFVPAVAALPAVIAAIVVVWQALRIAIPWRPRWTQPFSTDSPDPYLDELLLEAISKTSGYLLLLWVLVGAGCIVRLTQAALVWPAIEGMLQCAPWFLAIGLLVIRKPRTCPVSVLIILTSSIVCQSVVMANHNEWSKTTLGLEISTLTLSILAVSIILIMPLRDPSLPSSSISKPFTEATASLRSPEDNMNLWQFMTVSWMTPLIRTGFRRQLEDADVWQLGYEFQHRGLHAQFRRLKGTVMQRLLTANGIDLVIITTLGILETVLGFMVPVLLQKILSSMQDIDAPRRAAITYAAITLGVQLIKCQSGVFSLWFGRRCYERSRGEMITMLYEKTLNRKISFNPPKSKTEGDGETEHDSDLNGNGHAKPTRQSMPWLKNIFAKLRRSKETEDVKEPASMGKILNLMRNDVYEVAQRFWEFQSLITKPLSVIFSLTLVVNFLGWPAMLAVVVMLAAQITNAVLVRFLVTFETHRRKATDGKLQIVSQFVEAIRHLRWYGWQDAWLSQIMTARQKELNWRIVTGCWGLLISFINSLALDLSPSIGFYAYTVIGKKPLTVDIAFPALTLFNLLTNSLQDLPNLITVLLNAYVAVGRIEEFMAEPDKDQASTPAEEGVLAVTNATFAWPGTPKPVLRDLTLSFPEGLSVLCGQVASGKTALLQALLGELDMLEGSLTAPREPVGYCSQTPWLQSMSIRENILFSAKYEEERYSDVLDACALTPDLLEFKAGDLSFIGENGIGLSGGQKARVALARAAYSRSKILLLDDPLSALDQQTAETIVQKLFAGPLMKGRTIVLVTHRVDLVLGIAEQLIDLENGIATVMDNDEPPAEFLQRTISAVSTDEADQKQVKQRKKAVPEKFVEDEHRAQGGVKASVYWEYIKAGNLAWWFILVIALVLYRLLSLSGAWLLKSWGEAYQTETDLMDIFQVPSDSVHGLGLFDRLPPPSENIRPWVLAFFLIGLSRTVVWSISRAIMILIIYTAGKQMFHDIMVKVSYANFRFYDVTPIGRLMVSFSYFHNSSCTHHTNFAHTFT